MIFRYRRRVRLLCLLKRLYAAYIRHLVKCKEILAAQLITMHNIRFSQRLMAGVRQAIAEDRLMDFRNECIAKGMFD